MVSEALKELGRRLARRRAEAGLSTAELANLASVHEVAIQAYEEGRGELGASVLIRVADALGIKSGELLSVNAPESRAPIEPTVLLRTGFTASLNSADRAMVANALRRARAFREIGALLRVQSLADAFEPTDVPPGRPAHYAGEQLAATVRQQLPSRPGPLRNIQRLIEETFNILVMTHRFANSGVQGAACRAGSARVIVINSALRYEAMRRTVLAHELAHHLADLDAGSALMDEHGEDALTFYFANPPWEQRANAFAVSFLAPPDAVSAVFGPPPPEGHTSEKARRLVAEARRRFGLGPEAMTWHLYNIGYIRLHEIAAALILEVQAERIKDPERVLDDVTGFEDEPRFDGLERRVRACLDANIISVGRARELLGLSPFEDLLA